MKKAALLIAIVLLNSGYFAQKASYPVKETILNNAKNNYSLGMISRIFGSALTWDKIKLDYREFVNGGEKVTPSFRDYQSVLAQKGKLDYDDMTDVHIIATTPKNSEDKYFEIDITVTYTRYGGILPAKTWSYKECTIKADNYYEFGGSAAANQKRIDEILPILKNYKGEKNTPDKPVYYSFALRSNGEIDIVYIDSIYTDKKRKDENLSSQRFKYFIMACTFVNTDGGIAYYPGSTVDFSVEWHLNETSGKWSIATIESHGVTVNEKNKTTKLDVNDTPDKSYKKLTIHGFNEVYKTKSTFTRSLYTENDLYKFGNQVIAAIKLAYENPEKGKAAIEQLVDPTLPDAKEIIESYYQTMINGKQYLCELKEVYMNLNAWKEDDDNGKKKIVIGSQTLNVPFYREGTQDKELLKKYKDAGVSKESIKNTFGGRYDENWRTELNIVFKNNRWYITNKGSECKAMN